MAEHEALTAAGEGGSADPDGSSASGGAAGALRRELDRTEVSSNVIGRAVDPADAERPRLDRPAVSAVLTDAAASPRYDHERLLGVGANGRVYSVVDRDLDRAVALKVLANAKDREGVKQFLDEARIAASLTHPNVLPVHDIDIDHRGRPYFTMPRIDGRSLATVLELSKPDSRAAPMADLNAVVNMAIGVCQALGYAHHRAIVHQDIKPENIVLGDYGEILLVDWGSAIRLDREGPQRLYGTPLYMSPEQARREMVDRRSDIYGLGATLFHALFLRPPTWSDHPDEFWRKKRCGEFDPPTIAEEAMAPAPLAAIALKAMAADPAKRFQSADAMLADLHAYQAGQAVSAYRDSVRAAIARWYRRNRRAVWTGMVTLSALAVIAGMFVAEKAKDRASWHLIYGPGFPATPEALGKDWSGQQEEWWEPVRASTDLHDPAHVQLGDGTMRVHGLANGWIDLCFESSPLGAIKITWDFTSHEQGSDYNCFIGGRDRKSGYTFHIGSWGNPSYVALTRGKDYEVLDNSYLAEPLRVGRTYHFSLEKDGGRLRLDINGRHVFDYLDPSAIYGDTSNSFGFDCPGGGERIIANIAIYHRPLPQRVSPLIVGDKLLQLDDYAHAEMQYLDLERSYPGTDIARAALFRQAVCALRAKEDERGLQLLSRFEMKNPGHELIPYALYERLQVARRLHQVDDVARLRNAFIAYRGHPLLRMVMTQIAQEHERELAPQPVHEITDPLYPPDTEKRIVASYRELRSWGDRYGVSWWSNMYSFNSWRILETFGKPQDLVEAYPLESTPANSARSSMGLYDEVLRLTTEPYQHNQALFETGRIGDTPADGYYYWRKRLDVEGPAAVVDQKDCDGSVRALALLALRRYDDIVAGFPGDRMLMTEALIGLKRYEDLPMLKYPEALGLGLLAQDRFDDLVREAPSSHEALYRAVLRQLTLGRRDEAHALLADLELAQVPLNDEEVAFAIHLFPTLLRIDEGERLDLAQALAPSLERSRWILGQRMYHLAAYIAGIIDDAGFRAQPCKRQLEQRLAWARALRDDHLGHRDAALSAYRTIEADPLMLIALRAFEWDYLELRMRELEETK